MPNLSQKTKQFTSKLLHKFLIFVVTFVLLGLSLGQFQPTPQVISQTSKQPILIPLDKFVFSPTRENFTKPGVNDLNVKVVEYESVARGANCKFTFTQIISGSDGKTSENLQNTVTNKYETTSCGAVLKKEEQKSNNIRINVEITNSNGEVFGSFLNFLATPENNNLDIIDPNKYQLPVELYIKPEINIILEKKRLMVGDTVKVQLEVTNNDTFSLQQFSIKNNIPEKIGKIDCQSFAVSGDRLNGDIIKLPKVEVFAQESNFDGRCVIDQFSFEASLNSLKSRQTTRLNFDISVEKPGKLRFEITTNLDQGRISKTTEAIEIIVPNQDNTGLPNWVFPVVILAILSVGGSFGYYKYRQYQKRQQLNQTIEKSGK